MFVHMLVIFSTTVVAINFNTNMELGYCVKQEGYSDFVLLFFAVLLLTCFDLLLHLCLAFLSVIPMKKFKVLILVSSTLISFDISVLETTLVVRRFLVGVFPPPSRKDKTLEWQFCLL